MLAGMKDTNLTTIRSGNMNHIYPELLWNAQEGRCFHCNKLMSQWPQRADGSNVDIGWSREHFIPRMYLKKMQGEIKYNLVLAHGSCNMERGHRFPTPKEVEKFVNIYKRILP